MVVFCSFYSCGALFMSLFDLSNKTALITGASSGLGERFATVLSEAGARVILSARRESILENFAKQLKNARSLPMDVSDKNSVKNAFDSLEADNEKIDIVVCSAGIGGLTPIFDISKTEHFEKIIQTNLVGMWYVIQFAANHMKQHGIAGSIIPISSINGTTRVRENIAGYAASKAGVIQLTKTLTGELARENIRINCIAPGLFHTPMSDYKLHSPELKKEMAEIIPLNFVPGPEDLDGAILYLASNKASRYATGSCITVDGGAAWGGHGGK